MDHLPQPFWIERFTDGLWIILIELLHPVLEISEETPFL